MVKVKINGSWRNLTASYVKINGVWRKVNTVHNKISGVWREAWRNAYDAPDFLSYPATINRGASFVWTCEEVVGASYEVQHRYNEGAWSASTFRSTYNGTFVTSGDIGNATIQLRVRAVTPNVHDRQSRWVEGPVRALNAVTLAQPTNFKYGTDLNRGSTVGLFWDALPNHRYTVQAVYNGTQFETVYFGDGTAPVKLAQVSSRVDYNTLYFRIKTSRTGFNESPWLNGPVVNLIPDKLTSPSTFTVPAPISGGNITISWSGVLNAEQYILEEQYNDGTWTRVYAGPNRSATIALRDYAASALTVHYRVRATARNYVDGDWKTSAKQSLAPPPQKVSTWTATKTASWRSKEDWGWRDAKDSPADTVAYMYQGSWNEPPYWGNHRGLAWFDMASFRSTLAGKEILKMRIYFYRINSGGYTTGQKIQIWTHDYTVQPAGMPLLQYATPLGIASFARGESKWVDVPIAIAKKLLDRTAEGIALYREDGQGYLYMSSNVKIEVTYR